ncbi:alpha/beta fold hydrolase [Actinoplanes derwentensis]|uniref:Lysophospholipase, alpha-beta hydrolase superfamily n=1 Tax=Actinoplanes derwentensis TaxID=113562 RepID=A0A1H1Y6J7_9ACTN|nr:alpha/beta hydrolase [Actinoplanes derwentensis]GID86701.1 alpha/beta hydrolase [Actinoplanes derwentensis]SDT17053.1 Lysophospholipase, alpha-beta hydrolase superfamily [Actinoplanes derwentensis]
MVDVVARDVRFHVQRISPPAGGDGPVVVFLHGLILDNLSSFYYTLAGPVAALGAETIMYDLRGHGRSERPPAGYTVDDAVDDLTALLAALGVDRPVYLVGNSYGGVVALRFALRHPRQVAGLVVIEAHTVGDGAGDWTEHMSNTLTVTALGLAHDDLADQLSRLGDRKLARAARLADDLLNGTTLIDDVAANPALRGPDLKTIGCPVLAVYGEHSDLADAGRQLDRYLPDCTLHMIPGQAHTVLREATPLVRTLVLDWLTRRAVPA